MGWIHRERSLAGHASSYASLSPFLRWGARDIALERGIGLVAVNLARLALFRQFQDQVATSAADAANCVAGLLQRKSPLRSAPAHNSAIAGTRQPSGRSGNGASCNSRGDQSHSSRTGYPIEVGHHSINFLNENFSVGQPVNHANGSSSAARASTAIGARRHRDLPLSQVA